MWKRILNWFERRRRAYRTEWVEDLPESPRARTVYVVGGRKYPFYVAVVCPRKQCREIIHLPMTGKSADRWRLSEHPDKTVSLSPSVHVTGLKCRCHYWLRRGRIVWSESPPWFVPKENRNSQIVRR